MILKEDGKVKGFKFITESKPIQQRYSYVNNVKTINQLIANTKGRWIIKRKKKFSKGCLKKM